MNNTKLIQALRDAADELEAPRPKAENRIFNLGVNSARATQVHLRSGPNERGGEYITLAIAMRGGSTAHAFPTPAEARRIALALQQHAEALEVADDE